MTILELTCAGILFDNDGVLVDSHEQVIVAWRRLAAEYDLDAERLEVELIGVRAIDTLSRHVPGTDDDVRRAVDRLEDLEVAHADPTPSLAGATNLLTSLGDAPWAIVTSATRRLAEARWRGARIPFPRHSVTAEEVSNGKPDPEPFLLGAARLGMAGSDCIVFEDSPSGGIAGRAAGARVIAVGDQPWPFEPIARVPDLSDVTAVPSSSGIALSISVPG